MRQLKNQMASVAEVAGANKKHIHKPNDREDYKHNRTFERKDSQDYTAEDRKTFNRQKADAYKNQNEGKAANLGDPMIHKFPEVRIQQIMTEEFKQKINLLKNNVKQKFLILL